MRVIQNFSLNKYVSKAHCRTLSQWVYFFSLVLFRILQGQNEGLHHSLLQTAVRMECLGEEFMSSQKLLEAELQRTRVELSNLTERFKR